MDLDFFYCLTTVRVDHEHSTIRWICAPALSPADVPGVSHHQLEIVVVVDGRGDVSVVFNELIRSNFTILIAPIERIKECSKLRFWYLP